MIKTDKILELIEYGANKGYDYESIEEIQLEVQKEINKKEDEALFIFQKKDVLTIYRCYFTLWKELQESNQKLKDKVEELESKFDYVGNW